MVVAVGTMAEAGQMMRKVMAEEQRKAEEVATTALIEAPAALLMVAIFLHRLIADMFACEAWSPA